MKIAKLHILSLMVGALAAGGQASAAPTEADFNKTQQDARVASGKWRDEIKQSFEAYRKHEEYLKAMQDSSEKLRLFLIDKPCRDGAQAKEIEKYIHDAFHTLYGGVVADIKHGVDLNCRFNQLAVTFWITDFTPTAKMIASEKRGAEWQKSQNEIEASTKRIFGNWATAVVPSLTDKNKKIEDIRAAAIRASEQIKSQIQELSCPDEAVALAATRASLPAATKELSQNFTGYEFGINCVGKKANLFYDFANLKRKGP